MPAKPQWLLRLPEIIAELSALELLVVDRAVFEHVFRMRRRQSIYLLHQFGGWQAGKTFLIDRQALLAQLRRIQESPDYHYELRRRQRLVDVLDKTRRHAAAARVAIPVTPEALRRTVRSLPEGVSLQPDELRVEFLSAEDLLTKLYSLAQAIANDYEEFEKTLQVIKSAG